MSKELSNRVIAIEKLLDEHIHDGIGVWKGLEGLKTDVTWIKRLLWALMGICVTGCSLIIKMSLFKLPLQ